jgi:hypothetical protein
VGASDVSICETCTLGGGLRKGGGRERISLERQVRIAAGGVLAVKAHPRFGLLSAFIGGGLVFVGVTDTCEMARLLYNQSGCDVETMVEAPKEGKPPVQP